MLEACFYHVGTCGKCQHDRNKLPTFKLRHQNLNAPTYAELSTISFTKLEEAKKRVADERANRQLEEAKKRAAHELAKKQAEIAGGNPDDYCDPWIDEDGHVHGGKGIYLD